MKRKCKNVDITDTAYITRCVMLCMSNKSMRAWEREDIAKYWHSHGDSSDRITAELSREIRTRTVNFPAPRIRKAVDRSNAKERTITVEDIKNQYYNYIAKIALEELMPAIGEYQLACQVGKGPIWGAKVIKGWLNDRSIKYAVKADIRKCYPSITHENMMGYLRKRVKNDDLLYLIGAILGKMDEGLPIGSYLSITLCALYLSQLYHHIGETYFKTRRGVKKNMVSHVMFFLDDIYIFGKSANDLHKVMRGTAKYAESLGLTVKPTWSIISLNADDKNAHIDCMGYRIYRDHITMRHRDYIKTRKACRDFAKHPNIDSARSMTAYHGLFIKHTDSFRFRKKYNVKRLFRRARKVISEHDKSEV